jgi:hypothetical protein
VLSLRLHQLLLGECHKALVPQLLVLALVALLRHLLL